jgi:hypothetical protein
VRLELEAAIREARAWRYGDNEPMWLSPIQPAALELGLWLKLIPSG